MSTPEPPGGFEPPSPPPSDNPYGQQPPPPAPYGQQQPYGQPAYGQQPGYGVAQPYYGAPPPGTMGSVPRPGTVVAGAVIAMVMCGLASLGGFAIMAGGAFFADLGADDLGGIFILLGLLWIALCVLGIVSAAFAIAGSNGWRITLVVFAGITALFGVIGFFGSIADEAGGAVVNLVWGALAGLVIAFMFINGANAWYASNPRRK